MKYEKLAKIDGKTLKDWHDWLVKEDMGCCHVPFAEDEKYVYSVCMGWHDTGKEGWKIAWEIGRQSHINIMQSDLDLDFEQPWDEETGDVDDTLSLVDADEDWDALAAVVRATAERVADQYAEPSDYCA